MGLGLRGERPPGIRSVQGFAEGEGDLHAEADR